MTAAPAPLSTLRELLRLAWPLMLAQAAFLGMTATDTLIAGRYSAATLAGVGLGGSVTIAGFCLLMGLCLAVAPAVSRQIGAHTPRQDIGAWVTGALLLALSLWTGLLLLLQLVAAPLAAWLAPEPAVAREMEAYLRWSTWGLPALGLFFIARNVVEAHSISRPVMWWGLAAFLLNIPLDLILVMGWGPIPALGAAGCGIATSLIHIALGCGLWRTLRKHPATADLPLRGGPLAWQGARETWTLGLPVGLALLAESSLFALGGLMMARYGTAALAAHQIANTLAALAFMVQVGMGQATAVLVGRAVGARSAVDLRAAAKAGVGAGIALAMCVALLYLLLGERLAAAFSQDVEVRLIAASFMLWAAAFHVFDALQALHAAGLRGLHDTRAVMRRTLLAYGGVAVPWMFWLVLVADAPATGIWWAFSVGLAAAAGLLMWRFWSRMLPRFEREFQSG